jgi:cyclohexanone monooxygenase/acetone monooxygenase
MAAETDRPQVSDSGTTLELDAVVLGAGVAGLYQLREQGLAVRAFDAAGDVGGT